MKMPTVVLALISQLVLVACYVQCPVRSVPGGCWYEGRLYPPGSHVSSANPCAFITCSHTGQTLSITGCPGRSGADQHPPGAAGVPLLLYPDCCSRCPRIF
uniref:8.9 kDa family member n=1 Tax=Rhipicephalus appendiculatus TaxID=34631 RepID=A0A131Z5V1_RHIAP